MELNLADLFESLVDVVPERDAVACGDRTVTYGELEARANRLAHWMAARGIGAGDHIGLYLYNGLPYVETMIAALKLRAVPININYRYVSDELRYLCDNADLVALFYQGALEPVVADGVGGLDRLHTLVRHVDEATPPPVLTATEFEQAMSEGRPERDFPPRSADDLYIIYTGGTTGPPRGVMWRHEDVFYAGLQGGNPGDEPVRSADGVAELIRGGRVPMRIHPAAPLIHGAAQFASWICMFTGGTVGLVPGRSFDPDATCRLIQDHGMQVINLVGDAMARPLAEAIERADGRYDMSSLTVLSSAGAILSDAVKAQLERVLPHTMILNNFGASETGHQGTAFYGSGDRPIWVMDDDTRVLDDALQPVEPGSERIGKLARSGHIPLGYYKDAEKTAATFVEAEGRRWVLPGDLATVDADGQIVLLGRGAVCINSGGEKIFPEEVEGILKGHPSVEDAVVVGVADPRWGQRVAALVQLRSRAEASVDDMERHCRQHLAGYKVPREVHFLETVFRQPSGKPDYRWARDTAERLSKEESR